MSSVRAASGTFTLPPRVGVAPGVLDFGNFSGEVLFEIRNAGSGVLPITSVQSTVPWLTVTPGATNSSGLGTYRATASNSDLPRGTHNGTIEVRSSAGTRTLPVTISKFNFNVSSRLGAVHVHVNDAATGTLIRAQTVPGRQGLSSFMFEDVPPGTYTVTAGTDFNNDGNICDVGEICGSYPINSIPEPINYDGVEDLRESETANESSTRPLKRVNSSLSPRLRANSAILAFGGEGWLVDTLALLLLCNPHVVSHTRSRICMIRAARSFPGLRSG